MPLLTEEQQKFWDENGYVLLDDIFTSEEVEEMSEAYDEIFNMKKKMYNLEAAWDGDWKQNGHGTEEKRSVYSIHNLQCHSEVFTRCITNKRLADAASGCVGSPNVLLHHTKAHEKPPEKGTAYPPHQDYLYFPYKKHSMVACFIHLDDADPENGGLYIFPGSHKNGPIEDVSDNPEFHYVDPKKYSVEKGTPVRAKKGQVLIFSYFLVHASYQNVSKRPRRMFLIQMMAAEDSPVENVHLSPCQSMVLRGKNVNRQAKYELRHDNVM